MTTLVMILFCLMSDTAIALPMPMPEPPSEGEPRWCVVSEAEYYKIKTGDRYYGKK